MTECKDQRWLFQELGNRKVEVDFGGYFDFVIFGLNFFRVFAT